MIRSIWTRQNLAQIRQQNAEQAQKSGASAQGTVGRPGQMSSGGANPVAQASGAGLNGKAK